MVKEFLDLYKLAITKIEDEDELRCYMTWFEEYGMDMSNVDENAMGFIEWKSYLLKESIETNNQYALVQQLYLIPREMKEY